MLTQPTKDRAAAYDVLLRVEGGGGYSNIALREALRGGALDARQRAFCARLVHGVLERRITLDHALSAHVSRPLGRLDREVLTILRMGAFQLLFMSAVPAAAAVDQCVALCRRARKSSAGAFVNGALRALSRAGGALPPVKGGAVERLSVAVSAPPELCRLLARAYGEDAARAALEEALLPAPLTVRVNTLRADAAALRARLAEEGADARDTPLENALALSGTGAVEELGAFRDGWFHVQDVSSQRCARALDARPGMRVLDVCAAPGGKAFTAAEEMRGSGALVACDIHPHKIELIRDGARRLGLDCIIPKVQDAEQYNEEFKDFDRVLCDVPCSGLGVLRRRPEIKYRDPGTASLVPTQYKILENSAHYIREGGLLVYSTCTLVPAENEELVGRFLAGHPDFAGAPSAALGGAWERTFLPGEDGGDGFFVAVLTRRGR